MTAATTSTTVTTTDDDGEGDGDDGDGYDDDGSDDDKTAMTMTAEKMMAVMTTMETMPDLFHQALHLPKGKMTFNHRRLRRLHRLPYLYFTNEAILI